MVEGFKNLFFTVLGGVIVAGFSYMMLTERPEPIPELQIRHEFINVAYLDSIVGDWMLLKLTKVGEVLKDASDENPVVEANDLEKEINRRHARFLHDAIEWSLFNKRWYNSIHYITLENNIDKRISDIEYVNNFDYTSYIINKDSESDVFSSVEPGKVFKIGYLNPGSKLEIVAISNFASNYNPADVIVLSSGRRQAVEYINKDEEFIIPFLSEYPFLLFMLSWVGGLFIISIVIGVILEVVKASSPVWKRRLITESDYRRSKALVEFYEGSGSLPKSAEEGK